MIIQKYFSKKLRNESQLNVESIQMSKIGQNLVKIWSFGFEVWLETESILFGSYRSQDLTIQLTKTDFCLTEMKCCGYEWSLGIAMLT